MAIMSRCCFCGQKHINIGNFTARVKVSIVRHAIGVNMDIPAIREYFLCERPVIVHREPGTMAPGRDVFLPTDEETPEVTTAIIAGFNRRGRIKKRKCSAENRDSLESDARSGKKLPCSPLPAADHASALC
jgi:hypothetical protein